VEGITGATISSRAIGDIIANSSSELLPVIQQQSEVFKSGLKD
jgi:electron transport complex protein RnfG